MRLADLSIRIRSRVQKKAKSPGEIARDTRGIVLRNVSRLLEYNLRAAHEHVNDMERRLSLARQADGVTDLLRVQLQRIPESSMRISADAMRNYDILTQTYDEVSSLIRTELRKQWMMDRELPLLPLIKHPTQQV